MTIKEMFSKKKLIVLGIFLVFALVASRINFSTVIGAPNQSFTLFQFFGPMIGAFLGTAFGMIAVLGAELADYLIAGKAFTLLNLLRLLPMLFAVYYFSNYSKKKEISKLFMIIVPVMAITAFVLHPIGMQAWYFSLYWLIPIFAVILPNKMPGKLFFRSLGATFTAHAIGSIAFLYTVPMTAVQWMGLIPVVAYERLMFAAGIAVSYVLLTTVMDKVVEKTKLPAGIASVEKEYILSKKLFKITS